MPILNQEDDHQISDVLLSTWEFDKVDRRGAKENKERWCCGFFGNGYNIWNSTKIIDSPEHIR